MIPNTRLANTFAIIAATLISVGTSRGDISITAREVGSDVVFSYSGSIDLTGIGAATTASVRGLVYPVNAYVEFGGPTMINNAATGYSTAVAKTSRTTSAPVGPTWSPDSRVAISLSAGRESKFLSATRVGTRFRAP